MVEGAERGGHPAAEKSPHCKMPSAGGGEQYLHEQGRAGELALGSGAGDRANDVLSHYERAISSMQAFVRNQTGRVDLACVPSVAVSILPRVLLEFRAKYPGVEIDVHDADSPTVVEAVETGKVGLGVASIRREQPDLRFEPLFKDALGIVCRADDPLAQRRGPISWDMLHERTLLGNGISGLIDSTQFAKLISEAPITVYNVLSLLALIRAGVGITVLPRLSLPASESDLAFVPLTDPLARRQVGLLSRTSEVASPAMEAFSRELRRTVAAVADELDVEVTSAQD
jgi:LysR family carnitine catabolism transcriptional activator